MNAETIDEVIKNREDQQVLDRDEETENEQYDQEVMEAGQWNQYGLFF